MALACKEALDFRCVACHWFCMTSAADGSRTPPPAPPPEPERMSIADLVRWQPPLESTTVIYGALLVSMGVFWFLVTGGRLSLSTVTTFTWRLVTGVILLTGPTIFVLVIAWVLHLEGRRQRNNDYHH